MANNYTNVSFEFPCSSQQATQLTNAFDLDNCSAKDIIFSSTLASVWNDIDAMMKDITGEPSDEELQFGLTGFGYNEGEFYLYGDNTNLQQVASVIQTIVKPSKPIVMEWSNDCSKPITDSYGGGVCVIFADKLVFKTTRSMADDIINEATVLEPVV